MNRMDFAKSISKHLHWSAQDMNPSGRERRQTPRYSVRIPCSVSLPPGEQNILFPRARLDGHTRDVSESGAGIALTSVYIGYDCILDEGRALVAVLELPDGNITLNVVAAHYLRLAQQQQGDESDASYLIGLRITGMSVDNHARYAKYLEQLSIENREE